MLNHRCVTGSSINLHCVKSVHIQSFSGLYFPAFGLNTERSVFSPNVGKCGPEKPRMRKLFTQCFAKSFHKNLTLILGNYISLSLTIFTRLSFCVPDFFEARFSFSLKMNATSTCAKEN